LLCSLRKPSYCLASLKYTSITQTCFPGCVLSCVAMLRTNSKRALIHCSVSSASYSNLAPHSVPSPDTVPLVFLPLASECRKGCSHPLSRWISCPSLRSISRFPWCSSSSAESVLIVACRPVGYRFDAELCICQQVIRLDPGPLCPVDHVSSHLRLSLALHHPITFRNDTEVITEWL